MIKTKVSSRNINVNVTPKEIDVSNNHIKLVKGEKGAVFIPYVDEECNLSWTNDGGLENPPIVNIKGEHGDATVTPLTNLEIEAIIGR